MKLDIKNGQIVVYSAILGAAYTVLGVAESALGMLNLLSPITDTLAGVPADILGGFAALVIGLAYLRGAIPLSRGSRESLGYILVGTFLSAIFGTLYLLIVCADGLGALLALLEGEEWTWEWLTKGSAGPGLLRPEIWLFFASLPLAYLTWKNTKKIIQQPKNTGSYE